MPLSYDVIDTDPFYPWLKPTDVVKVMSKFKKLDLLLPCKTLQESMPVLEEYWRRFVQQFPDHDAARLSLAERRVTIPIRIHGDEGRSNWSNASLKPARLKML